MTRLFVLVGIVVVCVVGVGFYMGYFSFRSESADGAAHLILTVDQKKIQADEKAALEKARNLGSSTSPR